MKRLIGMCLGLGLALALGVGATTSRTLIVRGNLTEQDALNNWTSLSEALLNGTAIWPTNGTVTANKVIVAGAAGAVTWSTGTQTFAGAVTFDDGAGASPNVTWQDGTDETAVLGKVDAGNLTVTTVAGDGLQVLTGNLFVGNGTPGETINGEDLYVEGISEFDGTANFDGAVDFDGTITIDTTAIGEEALKFQGRASFTVCGDATTVNNNTIYYGPDLTVVSSATVGLQRQCNTTTAGNATEATADAPAFTAKAFYVLGMDCNHPDSNATLTFTARSAAAGLTPALVVTTTDNQTQGMTSAPSTTAIASGATFAVAVASTSDIGTVPFVCAVEVAY